MIGLITSEDIGRNGFTKRDIGKWFVVCPVSHVVYVRTSEKDAKELKTLLTPR